ncbi:MAG: GTP-binding protein [Nanoarchaeota archaeon]
MKNGVELLRIVTAGSVDDGKSTLIGRLFYDSKAIFEDQLKAIEKVSKQRGEPLNLALLVDGLKAEREQGITIDVAYRYFSTPKRKFIIADSPGHIQYTRNMVTGASTANLAIILVDARLGVTEQTKRHAFIVSLLQIPHLVLCINKMDLVNHRKEVYEKIKNDFEIFAEKLDIHEMHFIPISALYGDNIVNKSQNMGWYEGPSLLYLLENIYVGSDFNLRDCRFPVQGVIRPQSPELPDYRAYAGRVAGGIFKPGDKVRVLPSGFITKIKSIDAFDGPIKEARPPMSVAIQLEDDIDVGRGDMICRDLNSPEIEQDMDVMVCWLNDKKFDKNKTYLLRHTTNLVKCIVSEVIYKVNINTLHRNLEDKNISMNDIARFKIRTTKPLFYDSYKKNGITGSLILIDTQTNETVAAGIIR